MKWTPIPRSLRWALRSGFIGFVRDLTRELYFFLKRDTSQFGETKFLNILITEKTGFYIDIGSGRPISGSNTFHLYKRGWRGYLVDPLPRNRLLSQLLRPRDRFHLGLVGIQSDYNFHLFEPYAYSTTDAERASAVIHNKGDGIKLLKTLRLPGISLKDIFQNANTREFGFLNIDVEGAEWGVLESNDWNLYKPKVICIEIIDLNKHEIIRFLEGLGYELFGVKGLSYIFRLK